MPTSGTSGGSPAGTGGAGSGSGTGGAGAVSGGGAGTGAGAGVGAAGMAGMSMPMGGMSGMGAAGGEPPPPPLKDGEACTEDSRCESGNCDGVCCGQGFDCCKTLTDCPTRPDGLGMACNEPNTCQGTSGEIRCEEFKCKAINGVPNDTACGTNTVADGCGFFPPVFCSGQEVQSGAPNCPTSCSGDAQCDANAHCDENRCVGDLPDGQRCDENSDCQGGRCASNGVCCSALAALLGVECCSTAGDCPARFSWPKRCDNLMTCQGTSGMATCASNQCGTVTVQDDSACTGRVDCGHYAALQCSGATQQNMSCAMTCRVDGSCNTETAFCNSPNANTNGQCVPKLADGMRCNRDQQCLRGCDGRFCCNGEECCQSDADCAKREATCEPGTCQGKRKYVECSSNICIPRNSTVDDDSACTAPMLAECGNFKNIMCDGTAEQRACATSCTSPTDCDPGMVCTGAVCIPAPPVSGTTGGAPAAGTTG